MSGSMVHSRSYLHTTGAHGGRCSACSEVGPCLALPKTKHNVGMHAASACASDTSRVLEAGRLQSPPLMLS